MGSDFLVLQLDFEYPLNISLIPVSFPDYFD